MEREKNIFVDSLKKCLKWSGWAKLKSGARTSDSSTWIVIFFFPGNSVAQSLTQFAWNMPFKFLGFSVCFCFCRFLLWNTETVLPCWFTPQVSSRARARLQTEAQVSISVASVGGRDLSHHLLPPRRASREVDQKWRWFSIPGSQLRMGWEHSKWQLEAAASQYSPQEHFCVFFFQYIPMLNDHSVTNFPWEQLRAFVDW